MSQICQYFKINAKSVEPILIKLNRLFQIHRFSQTSIHLHHPHHLCCLRSGHILLKSLSIICQQPPANIPSQLQNMATSHFSVFWKIILFNSAYSDQLFQFPLQTGTFFYYSGKKDIKYLGHLHLLYPWNYYSIVFYLSLVAFWARWQNSADQLWGCNLNLVQFDVQVLLFQ